MSAVDPPTETRQAQGGAFEVITIGIDPHKRTHTAVAVSSVGELLAELTIPAEDSGHRRLLAWAQGLHAGEVRRFALEDCRGVNGRLERFLLEAGEHVLRVPPKLMANARKGGREVGKSDPIDALAVARAALREESKLHPATTDPRTRELKVLVDHREAWSTTAASTRHGCAGICTTSTPSWSPPRGPWIARPCGAASPSASPALSRAPR
jgi:transposase